MPVRNVSARSLQQSAAVVLLLGLMLVMASCAGTKPDGQSAVAELQRLTAVEVGKPVLVFVYTDG